MVSKALTLVCITALYGLYHCIRSFGTVYMLKGAGVPTPGKKITPIRVPENSGTPLLWSDLGLPQNVCPPQISQSPSLTSHLPPEGGACFPNHKFWSKIQRKSSFANSRCKWQSGRQCLDTGIWKYRNIYMFYGDNRATYLQTLNGLKNIRNRDNLVVWICFSNVRFQREWEKPLVFRRLS